MTAPVFKHPTTLTDLPPELWDHVTAYLPTASSVSSLSRTSRSLHEAVEKDAWKSFCRNHFPSTYPHDAPSFKDAARTLTTLSRAWDRRAFVARHIEPRGNITAYPGSRRVDRWKRPRGQTIGFTPQLDVCEEIGPRWTDRTETLAFSAGAELCLRTTRRGGDGENIKWSTFRPISAVEGRDDIMTLHLVRPKSESSSGRQRVIVGTASGDLTLVSLPDHDSQGREPTTTSFDTQGRAVRSSSVYQEPDKPDLLAVNLGDATLALYDINMDRTEVRSLGEVNLVPPLQRDGNPVNSHRAWSTTFLSPTTLSVGVGPSDTPVHVHSITESGISRVPLRKFRLDREAPSAVYTTAPLPFHATSGGHGNVFLSGAFDGNVRLHDLRAHTEVEQKWSDSADDSAVYCLLPRGRENFMTGSGRHNLLKVFDLRMGAKCYDYVEATDPAGTPKDNTSRDFNIFLRPSNTSLPTRGSGWRQGRSRSAESSIYSLASSSLHSPYIYAGIEDAIWSLAVTEILDPHPDPVWFDPWSSERDGKSDVRAFNSKEVQRLAMYNQNTNLSLLVQRSMWETWQECPPRERGQPQVVWDERWKGAHEF